MTSSNFKLRAFHFVLLVFVALGVRVGAAFVWEARVSPEFGFGDSLSYWTLGRAIATGEPYRYGAVDGQIFRTPGYPAILASLFLIDGDNPPVIWARMISVLFGTLSVVTVWWMALLLFDTRAAWIAGWVTALYPGAIATSVFVLSEAPFGLLMVLNLIFWVKVVQKKDGSLPIAILWAMGAGVLAGLATLVRPSWLLFIPFAVVVWFVVEFFKLEREVSPVACDGLEKPVTRDRANGRWYRMLRTGAASSVILFGLVLTMMPWWMRNYRLTESFIPTTLQTGAGLYDGLNPNADGSSDMRFVDHFIQLEPREQPPNDQRAFGTTFEQRVDNCMKHTAFSWAAKNPGRVAELAWIKFLRTWNVWPNEASLSGFPVKIVVCLTYVPVLFFAIWGGMQNHPTRISLYDLLAPCTILYDATHALCRVDSLPPARHVGPNCPGCWMVEYSESKNVKKGKSRGEVILTDYFLTGSADEQDGHLQRKEKIARHFGWERYRKSRDLWSPGLTGQTVR